MNNTLRAVCWACVLSAPLAGVGGCSSLRLPRIDPSGRRIFLPRDPAAAAAPRPACDWSKLMPSFKSPDVPPPESVVSGPVNGLPLDCPPQQGVCGPGTPAEKCLLQCNRRGGGWGQVFVNNFRHQMHRYGHREPMVPRGVPGTLQLSPTRLMAPVGTEVLLVSGLCGQDGYLVTKEPIEWLMSQESVGNFVDVGEPVESAYTRTKQCRDGYKMGIDYALTKTTSKSQLITRGTPSSKDDMLLKRGQTWVSLTSAAEGTSIVTALATQGDRWDQRRQTATIHWVDARPTFPPPATVRSGELHDLVTTVIRASDGQPAENWIVEYSIEQGESARFVQNGQTVEQSLISVRTNERGQGIATLAGAAELTGVVPVRVRVIRPQRGAQPRLPLAQSVTNIAFTRARLDVRCNGPRSVTVGQAANYQIELVNSGNLSAENVALTVDVPTLLQVTNAQPAPVNTYVTKYIWQWPSIEAGGSRVVTINAQAVAPGNVRVAAEATAAGNLSSGFTCSTTIRQRSLGVKVQGPQTGEVGQLATFEVEVSNIGSQRLEQTQIVVAFPAGLQERTGQASPIYKFVPGQSGAGILEPGEAVRIAVSFQVLAPGEHCFQVTATAAGGDVAQDEACIAGVAPQRRIVPKVEIVKRGPQQGVVGQRVEYQIAVANRGNVALNNVQVGDRYPASVEPQFATGNPTDVRGELRWLLDRLQPGDTLEFRVQCICRSVDPRAVNEAFIVGEVEGSNAVVQERSQVVTRIEAAAGSAPGAPGAAAQPRPAPNAAPAGPPTIAQPTPQPSPPTAPPENAAGQLRMSLNSSGNPVQANTPVTYIVVLENARAVTDQNVILTFSVPAGFTVQRATGPTDVRTSQGGTLVFNPIAELRPGENLRENPYRIVVVPTTTGQFSVRAEATSRRSPQGVFTVEPLTVLNQ